MVKVNYPFVIVGVLVGALSGCQSAPERPAQKSVPVAVVKVDSPPVAKPVATREQTIARLLREADYALSKDQLLMPWSDNAHDRYHAVLLLDRNNVQAKTGLQAITLRYLDLARSAAARSQYAQAQEHLKNARDLDANNPLVNEFAAILRREIATQKPPAAYKPGPNEHMIDAKALSSKSAAVVAQLRDLAQKAKTSGDLVMIIARNDAEGRWIYQQMRNALPGFLLRGDIKIGQQPRIQFVPRL